MSVHGVLMLSTEIVVVDLVYYTYEVTHVVDDYIKFIIYWSLGDKKFCG